MAPKRKMSITLSSPYGKSSQQKKPTTRQRVSSLGSNRQSPRENASDLLDIPPTAKTTDEYVSYRDQHTTNNDAAKFKDNVSVLVRDVQNLQEGAKINDTLFNYALIRTRELVPKPHSGQVKIWLTYFCSLPFAPWQRRGLFDVKYHVIPICEGHHWYVVILCNLAGLLQQAQNASDDNDDTIVVARPGHVNPVGDRPATLSTGGLGGCRMQKKDDPSIVILDSLGEQNQRSMKSAERLKEFVCRVAREEHEATVDPGQIATHQAPRRSVQFDAVNCGLFALGFIRGFVREPQMFLDSAVHRSEVPHVDHVKMRRDLLRDLRQVKVEAITKLRRSIRVSEK